MTAETNWVKDLDMRTNLSSYVLCRTYNNSAKQLDLLGPDQQRGLVGGCDTPILRDVQEAVEVYSGTGV